MAAENFAGSLAQVLQCESGWSDHNKELGGSRMHGISLAMFRIWQNNAALTPANLRRIDDTTVRAIYQVIFWNTLRCDDLRTGIDHVVFDMAVDSGIRQSAVFLQVACGMDALQQNGVIDATTIMTAWDRDPVQLIAALAERHERYYRSLNNMLEKAWIKRLNARVKYAHDLQGSTQRDLSTN